MFRRFVAGSAIAVFAIAVAATALGFFGPDLSKTWPLTMVWCFVPLLWGIWAMLTPQTWFPERLPYWGAILGLFIGTTGGLILNMPMRAFAVEVTFEWRAVAAVVMTIVYYGLWMLVRSAYYSLTPKSTMLEFSKTEVELKKAA